MSDVWDKIKAAMADVDSKAAVADEAAKAKEAADAALGEATSILEKLRNEVHDLLGGMTNRVRKSS